MTSRHSPLLLIAAFVGSFASGEPADMPSTLVAYERPIFPAELQVASISEAHATVAFIVEPSGSVSDAVALEATHVACARSVLDALPKWRFKPIPDGKLPRREVIRFEFSSKGIVASFSHLDASKAAFPPTAKEKFPIRTVLWSDLPAPPSRVLPLPPQVPRGFRGSSRVEVSYIIDTDGRVRVPIVKAEREDLGLAALAAVRQWRFAPPTFEGAPILVEEARGITFGVQ